MSWGLIINNVYLNRVATGELPDVIEASRACHEDVVRRLIALAASPPHTVEEDGEKIEWHDYVRREITLLLDEHEEQAIKGFLARTAKANPDDVTEV